MIRAPANAISRDLATLSPEWKMLVIVKRHKVFKCSVKTTSEIPPIIIILPSPPLDLTLKALNGFPNIVELHTYCNLRHACITKVLSSSFLNILMTRSVKHLLCDAVKREIQTNVDYL